MIATYSSLFNQRHQYSKPETDMYTDYVVIQEANVAASGASQC